MELTSAMLKAAANDIRKETTRLARLSELGALLEEGAGKLDGLAATERAVAELKAEETRLRASVDAVRADLGRMQAEASAEAAETTRKAVAEAEGVRAEADAVLARARVEAETIVDKARAHQADIEARLEESTRALGLLRAKVS